MRKAVAWGAAVAGFIVGAMIPYMVVVEMLGWREGAAMKIAAPLALLFAFTAYGWVIPDDQASEA